MRALAGERNTLRSLGLRGDLVDKAQRTADLRRRIEELQARMPKHSVPAAMMLEMDELEDELQQLQKEQTAE